MTTWHDFEDEAPDLAAAGRRLIYRNGDGEALLVTIRGADTPRAHPVNVGVVDGHLYTFVRRHRRSDATWTRTAGTRSTPTSTRPLPTSS
jgi:hypothetical protein